MARIRLTAPHTHAGHPHAAGETIDVPAATAAWITAHNRGIAEPEAPPKPSHVVHIQRGHKRRPRTEETHHGE